MSFDGTTCSQIFLRLKKSRFFFLSFTNQREPSLSPLTSEKILFLLPCSKNAKLPFLFLFLSFSPCLSVCVSISLFSSFSSSSLVALPCCAESVYSLVSFSLVDSLLFSRSLFSLLLSKAERERRTHTQHTHRQTSKQTHT